jgi:hypothetical protein
MQLRKLTIGILPFLSIKKTPFASMLSEPNLRHSANKNWGIARLIIRAASPRIRYTVVRLSNYYFIEAVDEAPSA